MAQHLKQVRSREGDTTFGRGKVRAGDMQEDRAAGAGHDRVVIVAEFNEQVVEGVITPEPLMAGGGGQGNRAIIIRGVRVIAPAIGGPDDADRQAGFRRLFPVGSIPDAPGRPGTDRRGTITFALVAGEPDAALAEGAADIEAIAAEPAKAAGDEVDRQGVSSRACDCAATGVL